MADASCLARCWYFTFWHIDYSSDMKKTMCGYTIKRPTPLNITHCVVFVKSDTFQLPFKWCIPLRPVSRWRAPVTRSIPSFSIHYWVGCCENIRYTLLAVALLSHLYNRLVFIIILRQKIYWLTRKLCGYKTGILLVYLVAKAQLNWLHRIVWSIS